MAGELGQQAVEFSALVRRAAEESFLSLKELVDRSKSTEQPDSDKKIELLKFILKTRQRMLRLHVLAKWCQQIPLVQYCQQLTSTLSSHDTCFTQAADSLFFMHEGLQQARAPIYDVPSAVEVLITGSYERLPKCIDDLGFQITLADKQKEPALRKLNALLRSKLLEVDLPTEISEATVSNGALLIRVDGEFEVLLTLGYRGHLSLWRILHLVLLVGEKHGSVKLEETRRYAVGDDLERRMSVAENPFLIVYTILHELAVALVMDTVIRQVQVLRQGRWKDAIRFDLISDVGQGGNSSAQFSQDAESDFTSLKTPGLKISYWLDSDRISGMDSSSSPFLKIEPGFDQQIKCVHSPFVLDPFLDREAEFALDHSCVDIERLLLAAIACHRHTRLLEIHRELCRNSHVCQVPDDVVLQRQGDEAQINLKKKDGNTCDEDWGEEVLRVRAYGSMYIFLGINIRNGRFHLQSSKNIFDHSMLFDCKEALNQGTTSATEVFISLRNKSILHLFASAGKFLGLKVYEQGIASLKLPKHILNGTDFLLMGFPQCGSSYYLMIQLDKDFKPLFKLLETRPDPSGASNLISESYIVFRFNLIDVGHMQLNEDELNLSLLNWSKLHGFLPSFEGSAQHADDGLFQDFVSEPSLLLNGGRRTSFSSMVDEVFEFEKGASAHSLVVQNQKSSFNSSLHVPLNSSNWASDSLSQIHNSKGALHNGFFVSSSLLRSTSAQKLAKSKSDQDLSSVETSSNLIVTSHSSLDDDHVRLLSESPKKTGSSSRYSQQLSSLQASSSRFYPMNLKCNGLTIPSCGSSDTLESVLWLTSPACEPSSSVFSYASGYATRKRAVTDILPSIMKLQENCESRKRRKISSAAYHHSVDSSSPPPTQFLSNKTKGYTYESMFTGSNHGNIPNVYLSSLLHVIRHCSLCVKHAQLTSQMDALDIPYVEETGLRVPSSSLWFRLPFAKDDAWQRICLRLGKPGTMCWDVKINDPYFKELWELQKGSSNTAWDSGIRVANASDIDSHIRYDPEGIVLSYSAVESDSIQKLVSDLQRLSNARSFACGMRKLLTKKSAEDDGALNSDSKIQPMSKGGTESHDRIFEQIRRAFKIEAVGLMSLWFCYGSMPVMAHFVVEWEVGKKGCTMHVSPDQLWPHTTFLEDFINGGEVMSFLDCVRLTAGPLLALANAIRPARMPAPVPSGPFPVLKQNGPVQGQGALANSSSSNVNQASGAAINSAVAPLPNHSLHSGTMLSAAGRGGPGIVPSSLLPIDVSVVLRGPYWIRIIYRKKFAVDMRCYAGDQVWLQPATPPKGGPAAGGSLPCPQFRPFIMEHVAQGLNALEPNFSGSLQTGPGNASNAGSITCISPAMPNGTKAAAIASVGVSRPSQAVGSQVPSNLSRVNSAMLASSNLAAISSGLPLRISPGTGVPMHVKGELNTAFIGLGDDGGYGGGWVPLAALKKVLRGILKYLGVLWLFAQLPELLKDILGSILKDSEGALLNLDQEQPALRFFVGGYVFAVSVHRVQLLLQVLSVKRFHHQQQQQQQQTQIGIQEELTSTEISEICDYFSRRVASEPYDSSRVASFITLLTLPISVLREFLKLIAWEKGLSQAQGGDVAPAQRARVELCLENHSGAVLGEHMENCSVSKSNIHHDRAHSSVEFSLTFVLDPALIPHVNAAGGAAWLPYCVSIRLKFSFSENVHISLIRMDGSHGGKACWARLEDWDKCKQRATRAVEFGSGSSAGDLSQGRLRLVAEALQRTLQASLQQLRDASIILNSNLSSAFCP